MVARAYASTGLGRNVEGDDSLRATLDEHFDEALAHEAAGPRHHALLRDIRERGLCKELGRCYAEASPPAGILVQL